MVHREKDFDNPPADLIDPKWDGLKKALLLEKNTHKVNADCYGATTREPLANLYANKCAVCERKRGMELQVDHYRPKKTRDNQTNVKYNQPGYYWLAYTWSNLIPLCSKCNGKKSNKFPLVTWTETKRVTGPVNSHGSSGFDPYDLNWLQSQEEPFMINPEHERTPERHFSFSKDGKIKGRTDEGVETINICGLNRKDLVRERVEVRQDYVQAIKEAFDDFLKHNDNSELKGDLKSTFRRIKNSTHEDSTFSLYHVFIYRYFDYFIGSKLPSSIRDKAVDYFKEFKGI